LNPAWLEPQPAPDSCAMSASVVDALLADPQVSPRVVELLLARREQGRERYGTELTTYNGRDADLDLLQELVDGLKYAKQSALERPTPSRLRRLRALRDEVDDLAVELESR
jgi:hypothetical protein